MRVAGDTIAPADTIVRDTIKAPLARAPLPRALAIGPEYRWDRETLFAAGIWTLADLLEVIPGATIFRSGWVASPQHAAYMGSAGRVRIYVDNIEMLPLDPATGGVLALGEVEFWGMEEVLIERGADELRVYMRSWRVDRTTAYTRTDVATGDQDTNLYRGFFGKRFGRGQALQVAGQQFGTTAAPQFGGGDRLSLLGRIGWATQEWSVDVFAMRGGGNRDPQVSPLGGGTIPRLRSVRSDVYARIAWRDPEGQSPWAQLMAARMNWSEDTPAAASGGDVIATDTSIGVWQYAASAGLNSGPFRLHGTGRVYRSEGRTDPEIIARADWVQGIAAASFMAERRWRDTSNAVEAQVRLSPLPFISALGAVSRRAGGAAGDDGVISGRVELGVRLGELWLSGGVLHRGETALPGLPVFHDGYIAVNEEAATGGMVATRGRLWREVFVDAWAVSWDGGGAYRPRTQTRSELFVRTRWLSRFPTGNFGALISVAHEYRDPVRFPRLQPDGETLALDFATEGHSVLPRLEIRILSAVLFWQLRYQAYPPVRQIVPGFVPPRQINMYGVRWEFWN